MLRRQNLQNNSRSRAHPTNVVADFGPDPLGATPPAGFRAPSLEEQAFLVKLSQYKGNAYVLPVHRNSNNNKRQRAVHGLILTHSLTPLQIDSIRFDPTVPFPSGELIFPNAKSSEAIHEILEQLGFDKMVLQGDMSFSHSSGWYEPRCERNAHKIWVRGIESPNASEGATCHPQQRQEDDDDEVQVVEGPQTQCITARHINSLPQQPATSHQIASRAGQVGSQPSWSPAFDASLVDQLAPRLSPYPPADSITSARAQGNTSVTKNMRKRASGLMDTTLSLTTCYKRPRRASPTQSERELSAESAHSHWWSSSDDEANVTKGEQSVSPASSFETPTSQIETSVAFKDLEAFLGPAKAASDSAAALEAGEPSAEIDWDKYIYTTPSVPATQPFSIPSDSGAAILGQTLQPPAVGPVKSLEELFADYALEQAKADQGALAEPSATSDSLRFDRAHLLTNGWAWEDVDILAMLCQ